MKLKEHNTIITGGSHGLGKTIAEHFVKEGANVVICARNEEELSEAQKNIATHLKKGQKILSKVCDVSSESQVNELIAYSLAELGSLHSLILNAGVYGPMGSTETVDLNAWRRAIDINLFGVLLPCRAIIPYFKKIKNLYSCSPSTAKPQVTPALASSTPCSSSASANMNTGSKHRKIIILSGGGATNPLPNISSYAASKAAVVRLMETLAEELKPWNVDVNAIAPGALATRLIDDVLAAGPEKVGKDFFDKNRQWKEQGATSLDLGAGLAVYLASSESDGITGKLISAQWDPWLKLHEYREKLANSDIYCLRRIVPEDRNQKWD